MNRADVMLAVQDGMTAAERVAFLERWYRLNPHQRGAQVADVLDQLWETDSHLPVTEALYEAHGDEVPEIGLLACAAYAAIYAYGLETTSTCIYCGGSGKRTPAPNTLEGLSLGSEPVRCWGCDGTGKRTEPEAPWPIVADILDRARVRLRNPATYTVETVAGARVTIISAEGSGPGILTPDDRLIPVPTVPEGHTAWQAPDGSIWMVPLGYAPKEPGHCRSCGVEVLWTLTGKGKRAPLDRDGKSHFSSCPQADTWRRR